MKPVRSSKPSPRSHIRSHRAPAAIGPYSQAVLVGDTLYCSGQIAIDPETAHLVTESLEEEAEQVLGNLGAVLRAASMGYEHVVHCTVYLTDINDYAVVNDVYARYFSEEPPARETVQVAALPRGAHI
ncbi:MAG: Rid family detoxifying hydrolase, partial [Rhodothermales bacterium]|nr:Rid family detoxifying hydrolase [Rhodothermales bacterium]